MKAIPAEKLEFQEQASRLEPIGSQACGQRAPAKGITPLTTLNPAPAGDTHCRSQLTDCDPCLRRGVQQRLPITMGTDHKYLLVQFRAICDPELATEGFWTMD
jgi:hypothetical protein